MSDTKNVKGNRQVVRAAYEGESYFKIPDGLDLEDSTIVEYWLVKWNVLSIKYVGKEQLDEIQAYDEWGLDLKNPYYEEIKSAGDADIDPYEDEDKEDEDKEICNECETDICLEDEDFRTQAEFDYLVPDGHYCEECSAKMDAEHEDEEERCPVCGEEWTSATRCECPNEDEYRKVLMTSFQIQMTKLHENETEYDNIFPNKNWGIKEYEEFFTYVSSGYLVQSPDSGGFMVNEEWEGEPEWE